MSARRPGWRRRQLCLVLLAEEFHGSRGTAVTSCWSAPPTAPATSTRRRPRGCSARIRTAPETAITREKVNQRSGTVKFAFAADETGSKLRRKLDKKPFKGCNSPARFKLSEIRQAPVPGQGDRRRRQRRRLGRNGALQDQAQRVVDRGRCHGRGNRQVRAEWSPRTRGCPQGPGTSLGHRPRPRPDKRYGRRRCARNAAQTSSP